MPSRYDLRMYRGDTRAWAFRLWQDEARTVPFDLTGYTAKAEVRACSGGPVLSTLTTTIETPNTVHATPTETIVGGRWDLQLTAADASVFTVLAGEVVITPDITDSS